MLSIEKTPRDDDPPPTSCPNSDEISQLKTSSSDERAVDLFNSGLDDNNNNNNKPPLPPKFSIRDYVFNHRSIDIKKNWPFSQEKLQLCLKNGMTQVLPPFQSLEALRNQSREKRCKVNSSSNKENTSNSDGKKLYCKPDAGCDRKLAADCSNINPSCSEGEKEFPSTTTSQSCSDFDSVPINKSPSLETLTAKSKALIHPKSNKAESSNQTAVKKCKLLVKLSNLDTSTKEDTAMNGYMVSEAMASKVCPVCKTFSSSSNTTLNAHIDQCLSGESTTKWAADSKVIKNRIKPRKMRTMVDIYETAPRCTLEELDRRNGTNWASNSFLPVQEKEICADQNKQRPSPLDSDETANESAVYIDANGTKLRILSKFDDPSLDSKNLDDPRLPKKLVKGDKGVKHLLEKKKKKNNQLEKQHKLLKHLPHGKKTRTSDAFRASEIDDSQDRNFSCEKSITEENNMQPLKALDKVKCSKPEMIRGWVSSKRTGLTKKINDGDDHLQSGAGEDKEMHPENNKSSLCTNVKRSAVVKIRSEKSPSPKSSKRSENSLHEARSEYREHTSPKKRLRFSETESQICHKRKRSLVLQEFPEHTAKYVTEGGPLNRENPSSSLSKRRIETKSDAVRSADHSIFNPKVVSSSQRAPLSKSKRFLFPKKHALSASLASASDSKRFSKKKSAAIKKFRRQYVSETNRKAVVSRPGVDRHFMQNPSDDQDSLEASSPEESIERSRVLKTRSGAEHIISREEVVALKKSGSTPKTRHHDAGGNGGSLMLSGAFACTSDAVESSGKSECACRRDMNIELPSEEVVEGTFMGFSKTLDPRFHGLEDAPDTQCDSQQFVEAFKGSASSAEPILSGEQEMFCTDATENVIGENVCGMAELDSSNGQGNYFGEVDSIPIPGPPGSFLPSPGRMDSEDLHGNSSLSSSRIQSSDDHQELIEHSSESPVSTTSSISNSTLGRSDVKSSEKLSAEPPLLDEMRSDFSAVSTNVVDPVVESLAPVARASNVGAENPGPDELKANNMIISDKGPFRFKNDQPCCCSRKENASQNGALNYQESALLQRRTMASATMPANGKQTNGDVIRRLDNVRSLNEKSLVTDEAASQSSMGHIPSRVSVDSDSKFPVPGDCESPCPPTPSAVLRLMGKNLMVVNKDENMALQPRSSSQSSNMNGHANSQSVSVPMVSAGNYQNEENHRVQRMASDQGPFLFDLTETKEFMQQPPAEMRWSSGFGNHGIPVRSQMSPFAMLSSRSTASGFVGSLMHHQVSVGGGFGSGAQLHHQPMNRSTVPMPYHDMEKRAESSRLTAEPRANTTKEIIIIDDTPDNEADVATHCQRKRELLEASVACDSWNGRRPSFYMTQPPYDQLMTYTGVSPIDTSFRVPISAVHHHHPSSLAAAAAASSSTAHLKSDLYNSSGF